MGAAHGQVDTVSLESLLEEMVNREAIARYPDPYYQTLQVSSHNRRSQKRGGPHWFANRDRSWFIRADINEGRKEYVMLEADGPGAIVRFWMTFAGPEAGQGTLRIYFDHEKEPTIVGKAFDVISGGALVGPPLSKSVSHQTPYKIRGHNLYLPLPFSEHIKITYQSEHIADKPGGKTGEAVYYNIGYRKYEADTPVETFSQKRLAAAMPLVKKVQQTLRERNKDQAVKALEDTETIHFSETLSPGEALQRRIEGPSAIRKLVIKLKAQNPQQALRSTILNIAFDGEETVWVPVGDFFGTGYQYRPSNTWYTTVKNETLKAYWVMPFKETAQITIKNLGRQPVTIQKGIAVYSDWAWGPPVCISEHLGMDTPKFIPERKRRRATAAILISVIPTSKEKECMLETSLLFLIPSIDGGEKVM